MSWQSIAEVTFTPDNLVEVVGNFSLAADDDSLWIKVTQIGEPSPNPWSYGILSWRSSEGHELGSTKCYGNSDSEVFRLGVGRPPLQRDGVITFQPRGFNLGWIREGFPWTLRFEAISGITNGGGGETIGAVVSGFVDTANNGLSLVRVNFP